MNDTHEDQIKFRNAKCVDCGHSRENHDSSGCLVWINADAANKCLCRVWKEA
jgi:hypothetical protein